MNSVWRSRYTESVRLSITCSRPRVCADSPRVLYVHVHLCARARWLYCVKSFGNDAEWQLSRRVSSTNPMQYFTWTPYDAINKVITGATWSNGKHNAGETHSFIYKRKKEKSRLLFKGVRRKNTSISTFVILYRYLSALANIINFLRKRVKCLCFMIFLKFINTILLTNRLLTG